MRKSLLPIIGALCYVIFPRDLLPDFMVGWGWLDDLVVLGLLARYYLRQSQLRRTAGRSDQDWQAAGDHHHRDADAGRREQRDPHEILGVAPDATGDEIKSAYRALAAQYHPDKVQHLGEDIQQLAELRFKEIQQAYEALIKS